MVDDEECKKCIEIVKDRQNELVCKIKTNYNDKILKLTQELYEAKKDFESCKITKNHLLDLFEIQSKRIAELEEQLKNAIVLPQYKRGQPIYYICGNKIIEAYFQHFNVDIDADVIENPHEVTDDDGFTDIDYDFGLVDYRLIYSTKEEAQAKLEELKGK